MTSLTIGIEFITGRCVAADVSDRERAEWPPHPGRMFMALAAACFEMGEEEAEVAALEWLEKLPPPQIFASDGCERSPVAVYVPVNDKVTANKSLLQSAPGLSRSKQERAFPTMIPDNMEVAFVWPDASGAESHIEALQRVCANVIRVGHSSSLVRAWATLDAPAASGSPWHPTRGVSQISVRVAGEGEFARLRVACGANRIDSFMTLAEIISSTKGNEQKSAKKAFEAEFGQPYKTALRPPEPTPPVLGLWQGYTRESTEIVVLEGEHFDAELLVLCKLDGPNVSTQDTLALTRRLRDAAMAACELQPPPAWLSGHELDGSATQEPHAAFLALPYVGGPYADGHVMGLAIALPKRIASEDRGRVLRGLLFDENDESRIIELKLGNLGVWTVRLEADNAGRQTLQNVTWVGPNTTWASVTPVVLDRFPKQSRTENRVGWNAEVAETIVLSCERAGLPQPIQVEIDTTSWHRGVPRAVPKTRRLRERADGERAAPLGDGYPTMPSRVGKPSRPQVHVRMKFDQAVRGPVIIGAGRFLGYGLFKPLRVHR
ncbi:MAG: type I-U CRISPR-associated protein Cas5/Cas6 [Planctomycetaceae bacterium]|nr:type I-U CRISPR-associated protein Cas5/Cas6 [Planctomycetaceae bacterium]